MLAKAGGGPTCGFQTVGYQSVGSVGTAPPRGLVFPYGLVNFAATSCTPGGAITVTLTYPNPVPADAQFWKFGPPTAGAPSQWYQHPAVIAGNTVSYSITDNGVGDRSNVLGQINDPAGLALPGVASVPTLNEWTLALLAVLLGGSAGWVGLRRGARATGRRWPPLG